MLDKIFSVYARDVEEKEQERAARPGEESSHCSDALSSISADPDARVDLHVHSSASDGSLRPEEVVRQAASAGLSAIALADHDTIQGIQEAEQAGAEVGLQVIPAVELTAYMDGTDATGELELHLIGLFVDTTDEQFLSALEQVRQVRVQRVEEISAKLRSLGFQFDAEHVLRRAVGESVGRVHVAQEMVRQGLCADTKEAFDRYLGVGCPAYVPKQKLTPAEAIALIHRAHGCAVLAHPGLTAGVDAILEGLAQAGLDGIEVRCPGHSAEHERRMTDAARRLGLAVSGGSDFHGGVKPDVQIGDESVSLAVLRELVERREKRS